MQKIHLEVSSLEKILNESKVLENISFSVDKGAILGVLGANGAGKSTLMKIIAGINSPTTGSISICGENLSLKNKNLRKKIGYLSENNPLYDDLYVIEYLNFVAKIREVPSKNLNKTIKEIAEKCGLQNFLNKKIKILSKGYKQRVGIAQSIVHDPQIIILDEPTNALDFEQSSEIHSLIQEISPQKTILISSHIIEEIKTVCSNAIVLKEGKIIKSLSLKQPSNSLKKYFQIRFNQNCFQDLQKLETISSISEIGFLSNKIYEIETFDEEKCKEEISYLTKKLGYFIMEMSCSKNEIEKELLKTIP